MNSALILAGGNSSRFGSNKAIAGLNGKPVIAHILSQLEPLFSEIIISARDSEDYTGLGLPVCTDILQGFGPLAGIHAGLKAASSEHVFVTACDMPFISKELICRMKKQIYRSKPAAVVSSRGDFIEPFHGFYSKSLVPVIEETAKTGHCGIFSFLKKIFPAVIESSDEYIFYNVNRPEDLEKLTIPTL